MFARAASAALGVTAAGSRGVTGGASFVAAMSGVVAAAAGGADVGVPGATERITTGQRIMVDGSAGMVFLEQAVDV